MTLLNRIVTVLLFFVLLAFSQEKQKLQTYKSEQDSISSMNKNIKAEIDSLRKLRDSMIIKLQAELRELYILKYGEEEGAKVAMGQVWTGMNENMMRDSWGEPDSISVNNQPWGKYSQWYYGDITYFFKDSKLFEWEEKEK